MQGWLVTNPHLPFDARWRDAHVQLRGRSVTCATLAEPILGGAHARRSDHAVFLGVRRRFFRGLRHLPALFLHQFDARGGGGLVDRGYVERADRADAVLWLF